MDRGKITKKCIEVIPPWKFNIASENGWLGRLLSFWEGHFSGAMLNFGGIYIYIKDNFSQSNFAPLFHQVLSWLFWEVTDLCVCVRLQLDTECLKDVPSRLVQIRIKGVFQRVSQVYREVMEFILQRDTHDRRVCVYIDILWLHTYI